MKPPLPKNRRASGTSSDGKIRILLVDDHPVVREGIRFCLARQPRLEIVGEAIDGHQAIAQAQALRPDIILMDINVPGLNGMEATAAILKLVPTTRVLALTAHDRGEYAQRIVAAGARGYVLKDASPQELVSAIEAVYKGDTFFSPVIARALLRGIIGHPHDPAFSKSLGLSPREREVLTYVAEGHSSKDIANRLNIGVRTIETHRLNLMRKLKIQSVAGLTKYALAHGLARMD